MNLFFWKKSEEGVPKGYVPYEEIDAKRTSKLGYFFLILMIIFGVSQGQMFLGAVQSSVDRPQENSWCLSELSQLAGNSNRDDSYSYNTTYWRNDNGSCQFSQREIVLSIDDLYNQVKPLKEQLSTVQSSIDQINNQITSLERSREQQVTEYQTSLLEDIADKDTAIVNQQAVQQSITTGDATMMELRNRLNTETVRKQEIEQNIAAIVSSKKSNITKAFEAYAHDMRVYELKQFLLSFLLIAPVFAFVWMYYHRIKLRRSEYTIIWGGILAIVSIIFAQILLVFVYRIMPKEFLAKIFEIIQSFGILLTLFYWFGFLLVPAFFGTLIYLIQKKFYNKRAVMMRALKSNHCPGCSLTIKPNMNHCPVCGYHFKSKCAACGSMTMDGGIFCEICGVPRIEQPSVTTSGQIS